VSKVVSKDVTRDSGCGLLAPCCALKSTLCETCVRRRTNGFVALALGLSLLPPSCKETFAVLERRDTSSDGGNHG
jgi:hypothetical protein